MCVPKDALCLNVVTDKCMCGIVCCVMFSSFDVPVFALNFMFFFPPVLAGCFLKKLVVDFAKVFKASHSSRRCLTLAYLSHITHLPARHLP